MLNFQSKVFVGVFWRGEEGPGIFLNSFKTDQILVSAKIEALFFYLPGKKQVEKEKKTFLLNILKRSRTAD